MRIFFLRTLYCSIWFLAFLWTLVLSIIYPFLFVLLVAIPLVSNLGIVFGILLSLIGYAFTAIWGQLFCNILVSPVTFVVFWLVEQVELQKFNAENNEKHLAKKESVATAILLTEKTIHDLKLNNITIDRPIKIFLLAEAWIIIYLFNKKKMVIKNSQVLDSRTKCDFLNYLKLPTINNEIITTPNKNNYLKIRNMLYMIYKKKGEHLKQDISFEQVLKLSSKLVENPDQTLPTTELINLLLDVKTRENLKRLALEYGKDIYI